MAKSKASKIAVILFTLRDYAKSPAEAARTLKRVRKIGYENIQVSGGPYVAIDPADMRKMADDAGLCIVGAHIGLKDFTENLAGVVERMHTYGAKHVAIPSFRPEKDGTAGWRAFGRTCNKLGAKLQKEGIALQYHNHAFEFEKFGVRGGKGGTTAYETLMAAARPEYLQAELDLAWVARGGYDPAAMVASLKGRVDQVHAKDWGVVGDEPVWRAVGEGGLNWPAVIKACKAAGVKTYIVEQDTCPVTNDPFKSIAVSFENLMQMPL